MEEREHEPPSTPPPPMTGGNTRPDAQPANTAPDRPEDSASDRAEPAASQEPANDAAESAPASPVQTIAAARAPEPESAPAPAPVQPAAADREPESAPARGLEAATTGNAAAVVEPAPPAPPVTATKLAPWAERPEEVVTIPRGRLIAPSRRDFLLLGAGTAAALVGGWWLFPDRVKARLLPTAHDRLDTLASRVGLTPERREGVLNRALTFDDDIAEALYSKDRRVRTYSRADITPLRNNYDGQTPGPETLPAWRLELGGLASGATERLTVADLLARLPFHEQITRLCCVEGWSAIAWWGGVRFADLLAAFPPAPGMRWAAMRAANNLDARGNSDPYFVSIDLDTARHPQTLLATHFTGRPLTLAHGAPLRLVVPMKLGLKNIKQVTHITYVAHEPDDYWAMRGYSKYDGL